MADTSTDDLTSVITTAHNNLLLHQGDIDKREKYFNGTKRLTNMGLSVPPGLEYLQTIVNWPRLAVESLEGRLTLLGFRVGSGAAKLDTRAAQWMRSNRFSVMAPAAHTEALIQGICYLSVDWDGEDGSDPVILPEPASTFWVTWDAKHSKIESAVRFWNDPTLPVTGRTDPTEELATLCTVYLPNETVYFSKDRGQWVETDTIEHNLGEVPVVPMVNRRRLNHDHGESEMTDIIPITDAASRALTDLQVAQEIFAMPKFWLLGADPNELVNAQGEQIPKWEMYLNAVNAISSSDAKIQQTQPGQLSNYSNVISTYSKLAASVSGIPAYYFGDAGDANPVSEGSIGAQENRHVIKAERRQDSFGYAWEEAFRIASKMVDKGTETEYQAVWQDASTPTFASKAVAVTQMFTGNLLSRQMALETLDYTPEQIAANEQYFAASANNDVVSNVLTQLGVTGNANPGTNGAGGNGSLRPEPSASKPGAPSAS